MQATSYTDQTDKFLVRSSGGHQYIMVLLNMDSSYIIMESMKNRHLSEIVMTYQILIDRLKACGINPKQHVLDNECSAKFKDAIKANKMRYQLVPPNDHRLNIAERAIQTAKSHIVSVLCGINPNFPMHLWDLLIPQMEIQLNLQRQSRTVPKVLAYAHHYGTYNYKAHSLAPLGSAVEYHVEPSTRTSWGMRSVSRWYIGISLEHYRCHRCWITETKGIRTGNTVFFKQKYLTMPTITPADALLTATCNLRETLEGDIPQSR